MYEVVLTALMTAGQAEELRDAEVAVAAVEHLLARAGPTPPEDDFERKGIRLTLEWARATSYNLRWHVPFYVRADARLTRCGAGLACRKALDR